MSQSGPGDEGETRTFCPQGQRSEWCDCITCCCVTEAAVQLRGAAGSALTSRSETSV